MAKKKETIIVGKSIFVNEDQRRLLDITFKQRQAAEAAFQQASEAISNLRNKTWEYLFDFYPELEGYHSNYNGLTGEIKIIGKKRSRNKEV